MRFWPCPCKLALESKDSLSSNTNRLLSNNATSQDVGTQFDRPSCGVSLPSGKFAMACMTQ